MRRYRSLIKINPSGHKELNSVFKKPASRQLGKMDLPKVIFFQKKKSSKEKVGLLHKIRWGEDENKNYKTWVSAMIHSARPTDPPVPITILAWTLFCLWDFQKWGRTYGRTTFAKTMITTGRDFGSAEWIDFCCCSWRVSSQKHKTEYNKNNSSYKSIDLPYCIMLFKILFVNRSTKSRPVMITIFTDVVCPSIRSSLIFKFTADRVDHLYGCNLLLFARIYV